MQPYNYKLALQATYILNSTEEKPNETYSQFYLNRFYRNTLSILLKLRLKKHTLNS